MSNMMDWLLGKMRLGYAEDEPEDDSSVYFKVVQSYADCKQVIDTYKGGAVCIYSLDPVTNPDAQGMMNYLCGGLYALEGDVAEVGKNTFMTVTAKLEA